ncbi:hypothetical protein BDQ12DRAFT_390147 [Crucibulum laeve]|uniref:Uncharacterized protein n=1 Tax=Crucibulum laeve TaxID=68775 RepID=A0A5C3M877_9AGAR|nr:hypothetical protein BDQ12DRAFT_390147 [Crucibulum laeve]
MGEVLKEMKLLALVIFAEMIAVLRIASSIRDLSMACLFIPRSIVWNRYKIGYYSRLKATTGRSSIYSFEYAVYSVMIKLLSKLFNIIQCTVTWKPMKISWTLLQ